MKSYKNAFNQDTHMHLIWKIRAFYHLSEVRSYPGYIGFQEAIDAAMTYIPEDLQQPILEHITDRILISRDEKQLEQKFIAALAGITGMLS